MSDAELRATGQVLTVVPTADGRFGVLVGPVPDTYWYLTTEPPKLGTTVTLSGTVDSQEERAYGNTTARLTRFASATVQFEHPPYAIRVVPPEWLERVDAVMRRPLYRYQTEGAGWIASRIANGQGAILADDPGLGKSAQTVAALCATQMFPTLLVCPTSLKFNWVREFGWAKEPPSVHVVNGRSGDLPSAQVYVTNYDLLRYREAQFYKLGALTMVLDEAQNVKEPRPSLTHRASVADRLGQFICRVIELTGTPIMNRPEDLWRLLHIVDPGEWPAYQEYYDRYCKAPEDNEATAGKRVVTSCGRVEHLEELQTLIQPVLLRRLKSEVLPDLPPKSRRSVLVSMDEIAMQTYETARCDILAWLRSVDTGDRARSAARAEAFARLTYLRKLAAIGKMHGPVQEYLNQWFDRAEPQPLVIFAYHRDIILGKDDMIGLYRECTEKRGLRVSLIGSQDSASDRQEAVDRFQNGETDVFIAPIKCGGAGLNLQRASDTLFIERTWNPSEMTQAEDRVHRVGTIRPVTATYLDAVDTIDERLAEVIEAKQVLIRNILDEEQSDGSVAVLDSILDAFKEAS